ncbi:MAG: tetratricopeptide repeat protein [Alicyclobacillus sp.]|nr:tetratricopeptide repeat protein [Alicyclobacillus sp.]
MRKRVWAAALAAVTLLAAGCGSGAAGGNSAAGNTASSSAGRTSNAVITTNSNGQKAIISGGQPYEGQDKLQQLEKTAQANPNNEQDQIQAAIAAYVNGDLQKALDYYQKANKLNPKDPIPLNNMGNIYFRGMNKPKDALTYYKQATEVNSAYSYAWWNLGLCYEALGDKTSAKQAFETGLQKIPKTDVNYKNIQDALNLLEKSKS